MDIPLWIRLATTLVALGAMFIVLRKKIDDAFDNYKGLSIEMYKQALSNLHDAETDLRNKIASLENDMIDALHTSKTAHQLIEREAAQLKDIESKFKELRGEVSLANNRSMSALDMIKTIGKGTKRNTDEINKLKGNEPVAK